MSSAADFGVASYGGAPSGEDGGSEYAAAAAGGGGGDDFAAAADGGSEYGVGPSVSGASALRGAVAAWSPVLRAAAGALFAYAKAGLQIFAPRNFNVGASEGEGGEDFAHPGGRAVAALQQRLALLRWLAAVGGGATFAVHGLASINVFRIFSAPSLYVLQAYEALFGLAIVLLELPGGGPPGEGRRTAAQRLVAEWFKAVSLPLGRAAFQIFVGSLGAAMWARSVAAAVVGVCLLLVGTATAATLLAAKGEAGGAADPLAADGASGMYYAGVDEDEEGHFMQHAAEDDDADDGGRLGAPGGYADNYAVPRSTTSTADGPDVVMRNPLKDHRAPFYGGQPLALRGGGAASVTASSSAGGHSYVPY